MPPPFPSRRHFRSASNFSSPRAFSLVEVTMAMGIIAFAFVAIFGMLPLGMTTFRQTIDLSTSSQIAQKVIGDAIQTDFDTLIDNDNLTRDSSGDVTPANFTFRAPFVKSPGWRYFDDQGTELKATEAKKAIYHVSVRINPQAKLPNLTSDPNLSDLAQVTVQVVLNPGNRVIDIADSANASDKSKPLRNLVDTSKKWTVYTYTAMIAKNK